MMQSMVQSLSFYLHDMLRLLAVECAFCLELTQCSGFPCNDMDAVRYYESEDASLAVCKVYSCVYVGIG
jgi:hypothetical protein